MNRAAYAAMVGMAFLFLCPAASAWAQPTDRISGRAATATGVRYFKPDHWGTVSLDVQNATDEDGELLVSVFFDGHRDTQFARSVWVPAGAFRRVAFAVRAPEELPEYSTELHSLMIDRSSGREVLITDADGNRMSSNSVMTHTRDVQTGLIWQPPFEALENVEQQATSAAYETVISMRVSQSLTRRLVLFQELQLPNTALGYDGLDQLVISSDRILADSAALLACRHWLAQGGRMWIMLDQVSPELLHRLLGDAVDFQIIDRVPLSEVSIASQGEFSQAGVLDQREHEQPVTLTRLLVEDAEVTHTVDGWPAAFWIPYGRGEVLVTTLSAEGWVRPRVRSDGVPTAAEYYADFVATMGLTQIASRFLAPRPGESLSERHVTAYLSEHIGYQIPSRQQIFLVLSGFCTLFLILSVTVAWLRRTEHLAWLGPVLVVATAAIVIGMGVSSKQGVRPTVAQLQAIHVGPGSRELAVSGHAAIYYPESANAKIQSRVGGALVPESQVMAGGVRRILFQDLDHWHWENLILLPGVRKARLRYNWQSEEPIRARATFSDQGLTGQLTTGDLGDFQDALVAVPPAAFAAVRLGRDGSFWSGSGDRLPSGTFLGTDLFSDEQRRRQKVFELFLTDKQSSWELKRPTLLAWCSLRDDLLQFDVGLRSAGGGLVILPLELERAAANQQVRIPNAFLRPIAVQTELGHSATFDNPTGQWIAGLAQPTKTRLRFQLPQQVLPITLERAELSLRCTVPSRTLTVSVVTADGKWPVLERRSPAGSLRTVIDQPELLALDKEGGLIFEIAISELHESDGPLPSDGVWTMDYSRLEVLGRTGASQISGDMP